MTHQEIYFTNEVKNALNTVLSQMDKNYVFVLTDKNVKKAIGEDVIADLVADAKAIIEIEPGDVNKNLETVQLVWSKLQQGGATRKSVMVNFGGGVVTDLGGFAAATFKRGIRFVNVPTTLLSAVDAAVGGKTGVNFNGLKNEIGVFKEAEAVIISTRYLASLPESEIKSGYAEMLKHGLLKSTEAYNRLLQFDFNDNAGSNLLSLLEESVNVKREIVIQDPLEKGLRRALNLGHTAGHAFESMALHKGTPIPHGYAVAWGLVVETVLSHTERQYPSSEVYRLAEYILTHYGAYHITCDDYPALLDYMAHDKKSENCEYNFSLLSSPGNITTGCVVTKEAVEAALDIYRDLMHI